MYDAKESSGKRRFKREKGKTYLVLGTAMRDWSFSRTTYCLTVWVPGAFHMEIFNNAAAGVWAVHNFQFCNCLSQFSCIIPGTIYWENEKRFYGIPFVNHLNKTRVECLWRNASLIIIPHLAPVLLWQYHKPITMQAHLGNVNFSKSDSTCISWFYSYNTTSSSKCQHCILQASPLLCCTLFHCTHLHCMLVPETLFSLYTFTFYNCDCTIVRFTLLFTCPTTLTVRILSMKTQNSLDDDDDYY